MDLSRCCARTRAASLVSKAVRREITAAGATEGTERQQEQQQLNVGIMPSFPASLLPAPLFHTLRPTFCPAHRSFSLSLCVLSGLSCLVGGSRARGRQRPRQRKKGGGGGLSEKKGGRGRGVRDVSGGSIRGSLAGVWIRARGGEGREPEGGRDSASCGGERGRGRGFGSRNGFGGVRTVLVLG